MELVLLGRRQVQFLTQGCPVVFWTKTPVSLVIVFIPLIPVIPLAYKTWHLIHTVKLHSTSASQHPGFKGIWRDWQRNLSAKRVGIHSGAGLDLWKMQPFKHELRFENLKIWMSGLETLFWQRFSKIAMSDFDFPVLLLTLTDSRSCLHFMEWPSFVNTLVMVQGSPLEVSPKKKREVRLLQSSKECFVHLSSQLLSKPQATLLGC